MAEQKQGDPLEHTYSSYVKVRDVVQKTCRRRLTIGKSGKRGSGISVRAARHDDDDDDDDDDEIKSDFCGGEYAIVIKKKWKQKLWGIGIS